jgi:hypothetical protein
MVVLFAIPIEVAGIVLCRFHTNCTNKFVIAISFEVHICCVVSCKVSSTFRSCCPNDCVVSNAVVSTNGRIKTQYTKMTN